MRNTIDVRETKEFSAYFQKLKDPVGRGAILSRLKRLTIGQWGDASPVGDGLIELRIHTGPGYRVYCKKVGDTVVVVLGAGIKNRQQADIEAAMKVAKAL